MSGAPRLLATLAVAGALRALGGRAEAEAEFAPTVGMLARIRGGERADAAILTDEGIDALIAEGVLEGARTPLFRSHIGLAVRAGATHPPIGTAEALRAALLATPSIVLSRTGASGIAFAGVLDRLGIAEAVNAKATVIAAGFTAEAVARGEAAMAVQQVSELMAVPGVEVIGRLPPEVEVVAGFSAAVFRGAGRAEAAGRLIRFLASAEAAPALRESGLEPAGSG